VRQKITSDANNDLVNSGYGNCARAGRTKKGIWKVIPDAINLKAAVGPLPSLNTLCKNFN